MLMDSPQESGPVESDVDELTPVLRLIYVSGDAAESEDRMRALIEQARPDVRLTMVSSPAAAVAELTSLATVYQGLIISPHLDADVARHLISRIRAGRYPVPILCLQGGSGGDPYPAAVTAGADGELAVDGCTTAQASQAIDRLQRSPWYQPPDAPRRLRLLYLGADWLVWKLLDVVPFVAGERTECAADASCPIFASGTGALTCDAVLVDDRPGPAKALDVVRWLKREAPELPVILLSRHDPDREGGDADTEADEAVVKSGVYRPRLLTALRRAHRAHALRQENAGLTARSTWLRHVVERLPESVILVGPFGTIIAANQAGLSLLGVASLPEAIDKPLTTWVEEGDRDQLSGSLREALGGGSRELTLDLGRAAQASAVRVHVEPLGSASGAPAGVIVRTLPTTTGAAPGPLEEQAAVRDLREQMAAAAAAHEAERERWSSYRRELEARVSATEDAAEDARRSQRDLETSIQDARAQVRQASATHDSDRERWEAAHRSLEKKLAAAEAAHVAALGEQHRLDAARQVLASRVAELDALDVGARALEAERDQLRANLAAVTEAEARRRRELEAAHAAWDAERRALDETRREIEARVAELEAALAGGIRDHEGARERLRTELDAAIAREADARREQQAALVSWNAERQALEQHRRDLENRLAAADRTRRDLEARLASGEASRGELEGRVHAVESAKGELEQRLKSSARAHGDVERRAGAAEAARADLERRLSDVEAAALSASRDLHADRDRLTAELDALRQTHQAVEARLADVQRRERDARDDLETARTSWDAERRALEIARHEVHARLVEARRQTETMAAARARLTESPLFAWAVTTVDGELVHCNERFARLFGYADPEDVTTRHAGAAFPGFGDTAQVDPAQLPRLQSDACLTAVDGRVLYVTQWMDAIPPTATEPARVERLLIDVTAKARREERLREARRLEQFGTLAAMMMPDIQALVASVRQAGRNLSTVTDAAEAAEQLRHLEAQVAQADGLVIQLAAFSRRQVRPRDRLSLNEGVERVVPTLRRLTGSEVTLELALGASATVVTSQDDLERMLTSLVIAARDLLPSGGRVIISTHRPDPLDRLEFGDEPAVLRPARLRITAEGYQVEPFSPTASLERVVARCDGVLHVHEPAGRRLSFDIDLPTVCPTRPL